MSIVTALPPEPSLDERIADLLASPEPLRRWLSEQYRTYVGMAKSARLCPLAEFLRAHLPEDCDLAVYSRALVVYGQDEIVVRGEYDLPPWAEAFRCLVDTKSPHGGLFMEPVPREWALAALDDISDDLEDIDRDRTDRST